MLTVVSSENATICMQCKRGWDDTCKYSRAVRNLLWEAVMDLGLFVCSKLQWGWVWVMVLDRWVVGNSGLVEMVNWTTAFQTLRKILHCLICHLTWHFCFFENWSFLGVCLIYWMWIITWMIIFIHGNKMRCNGIIKPIH